MKLVMMCQSKAVQGGPAGVTTVILSFSAVDGQGNLSAFVPADKADEYKLGVKYEVSIAPVA